MSTATTDASLDRLEADVLAVAEFPPVSTVAQTMQKLDYVIERARAAKAKLQPLLIDYINATGPIEIGDLVYIVGTKKTTKCIDVAATIQAVLEATGGDFTQLCAVLSSQPVKYGAAREVLGEARWAELFDVKVEATLEGKPVKAVLKIDRRFTRKEAPEQIETSTT
jgi:hypothetical protein